MKRVTININIEDGIQHRSDEEVVRSFHSSEMIDAILEALDQCWTGDNFSYDVCISEPNETTITKIAETEL